MKKYLSLLNLLLHGSPSLQTKSIAFPFFSSQDTPQTLTSVKNGFVGKIENITFCTWVSFYFFKKDTFLLYDVGNGTKNEGFSIQLYKNVGFLAFGEIWYLYELPPGTKEPETWHQFCFSLDFEPKIVKMYIDDMLVMLKEEKKNLEDFKFSDRLVERSIFGKKFYQSDPYFGGQFTGVNIWSSVLPESTIKVNLGIVTFH